MTNHKKNFIILEAAELIKKHEGWRSHVYNDTDGIELKPHTLSKNGTPTIGWGFNLSTSGPEMPKEVAELWLVEYLLPDIYNFIDLDFHHVPLCVKIALIDMVYNLGKNGFLKFKKTIKLLKSKDYAMAADEMLQSKWAKQVGKRAIQISRMVESPDLDGKIWGHYEAKFAGYLLALETADSP